MNFENIIYTLIISIVLIPTLYFMLKVAMKNECAEYVTETVDVNKFYLLAFIPPLAYVIYACLNWGVNMYAVIYFIIAMALGWSCITDFKHQELADTNTLIFFVLSLGIWLEQNSSTQMQQVLATIATTAGLSLMWKFIGGIGFGDIKLLIPILLFLRPDQYLAYLGNSIMIAFIYAVGLILLKKTGEDRKFAFGPFLIYGFYLTLVGFDALMLLVNTMLSFL